MKITRDRWPLQVWPLEVLLPFLLFIGLAGNGIGEFFGGDDVMNLFHYLEHPASYWLMGLVKFWSSAWYRPLGGLVYLAIYRTFGFHPLPFKVFLFAALLGNMILYLRTARELSGSRQIAVWALLLCSYHAAMNALYLNFGTIYDVLGYSFYFSAVLTYAGWVSGKKRSGLRAVLIPVLYIAGLCCKEIVVTMPAVLALYNLLLTDKPASERWKWPIRSGLPILLCCALGAIYTLGKLTGPETLANQAEYAPHFTLHQYASISAHYIRELFYLPTRLPTPTGALWIMASMLIVALLLRSGLMVFCLLCIVISQLPVSFMAPRGAFAVYIPAAFWALYGAAAIERGQRALHLPGAPAAYYVAAAILLAALHFHMKALYDPNFTVQAAEYGAFSAQLDAWGVKPSSGERVLLINDPFRRDWIGWDPLFIISVRSGKTDIVVNRMKFATYVPPLPEIGSYDYLIDYDSRWRLARKPGMPRVIPERVRDMAADTSVLLLDGFHLPAQSGLRQVDAAFRILTRVGKSNDRTLSLSFFATAPVRMFVRTDEGPFVDKGLSAAGNVELTVPLVPNAATQEHTLTFQVQDSAGKPSSAELFVNADLH